MSFMFTRWRELGHQRSVPLLKRSVISCLEEAEKHNMTSIAIPAISCGVFGGDPDQSAQLIVEAVAEFFEAHRKTCVQRVRV